MLVGDVVGPTYLAWYFSDPRRGMACPDTHSVHSWRGMACPDAHLAHADVHSAPTPANSRHGMARSSGAPAHSRRGMAMLPWDMRTLGRALCWRRGWYAYAHVQARTPTYTYLPSPPITRTPYWELSRGSTECRKSPLNCTIHGFHVVSAKESGPIPDSGNYDPLAVIVFAAGASLFSGKHDPRRNGSS